MSKAWFISPSGELVALGQCSDFRLKIDEEDIGVPLIRRTTIAVNAKLTAEQWRAWASWFRDERRYLRLRRQHRLKGRGNKWKHAA